MQKLKHLLFLSVLGLVFLFQACGPDETINQPALNAVSAHDHTTVSEWNAVYLEVERYAPGYRPGPAPRSLAYMGLSAYEACVSGMPAFNSLQARFNLKLPRAEEGAIYYWPAVVSASYATLMPRFFPHVRADLIEKIKTLETQQTARFQRESDAVIVERSKKHGEAVANAIWEWSKTDQIGHDAYLDPFGTYDWEARYRGIGDWRPTTPGPGRPMFPRWGQARTFSLRDVDLLARPPLSYSDSPNSPFYAQALEVYVMNTPTLSYESEWIGEFWSDDLVNLTFSPGPRWIAVATQVYERERSNLETALYANAKTGLALNDANVACWHSKYHYNLERPESYIKRVIDPKWEPALFNPITGDAGITPSFPAYPSGHSTMGAAGAEALSSIFGYNYAMTDRCHEGRTEFVGTPRSFASFAEMARENAWSRVPLGVHFRMDADEGVRHGLQIGNRVNELGWKK